MDIRRRASRKRDTEWLTVVSGVQPAPHPDANGRVVLLAESNPSPRDEGSQYDYEVILTPEDIERILASRKLVPDHVAEGR